MVEPTTSSLVVLTLPPISIEPNVEKRPKCRVELLTFKTNPSVLTTPRVLTLRTSVFSALTLNKLPTSRLQSTAIELNTERLPVINTELCSIVDPSTLRLLLTIRSRPTSKL